MTRYSNDAEQAVLGGLLNDPSAIDRIVDVIDGVDFFDPIHAEIFRVIEALVAKNLAVTVITVAESFDGSVQFEEAGGLAYLASLYSNTPGAAAIRHHAQIVRNHSLSRQLASIGAEMLDKTGPVAERIEQAQRAVLALTEQHETGGVRPVGDLLTAALERIDERFHRPDGSLNGLPTGFRDLDARLCGMRPGQLIVVAGRPAMGKTSFAMQIVEHNAMAGTPCLVFSLEMTADELIDRMLSGVGNVPFEAINTGRLQGDQWNGLTVAVGKLRDAALYIDDTADMTIARMRARARAAKRRHGVSLIVVDYLQLTTGSGEKREQQVAEISRGLKLMAKELAVPVIVLSQINRAAESGADKRPQMTHLRESGAIEQDADVILMLHRQEVYEPDDQRYQGVAEVLIRKGRSIKTGTVPLTWIGERTHFAGFAGTPPWEMPEPEKQKRGRKTFDDGEPF